MGSSVIYCELVTQICLATAYIKNLNTLILGDVERDSEGCMNTVFPLCEICGCRWKAILFLKTRTTLATKK